MDITYLGHSSFRIKTKTATIITDPFDPVMVGLKYSGVDGDIVAISHDHKDHNAADKVSGVKKIVSGPGEYEIMGVSILGYSSFHDDKDGAERGKNTIYVFEAEGLRLAHLGDLGHRLTQEHLREIGEVDILFVPVGGVYTIGPEEAVEVINGIEPKVIIPMHYSLPGLAYKLSPVEDFIKEIGITPQKMDKYVVSADKLPEERQLVILDLKN